METNNKSFLLERICGYTIQVNTNKTDWFNDEHKQLIVDKILNNELKGVLPIRYGVEFEWQCVVFVVTSDWCDEYEQSNVVNGTFNELLLAKKCFFDVLQQDYKNNPTHHAARNEDKEYYTIESDEYHSSIYLNERYSEWHFDVDIHIQPIKTDA